LSVFLKEGFPEGEGVIVLVVEEIEEGQFRPKGAFVGGIVQPAHLLLLIFI
jgi:hypothetical protein